MPASSNQFWLRLAKKGPKNSHKTIIISILEPIETGLDKEEFTKILENKIYSELNILN